MGMVYGRTAWDESNVVWSRSDLPSEANVRCKIIAIRNSALCWLLNKSHHSCLYVNIVHFVLSEFGLKGTLNHVFQHSFVFVQTCSLRQVIIIDSNDVTHADKRRAYCIRDHFDGHRSMFQHNMPTDDKPRIMQSYSVVWSVRRILSQMRRRRWTLK